MRVRGPIRIHSAGGQMGQRVGADVQPRLVVTTLRHHLRMADDQLAMPERLIDDEGRPVRPCIQCRRSITYPSQPARGGDLRECGVRQYLTAPSVAWPTGGLGRDWDHEGLSGLGQWPYGGYPPGLGPPG